MHERTNHAVALTAYVRFFIWGNVCRGNVSLAADRNFPKSGREGRGVVYIPTVAVTYATVQV